MVLTFCAARCIRPSTYVPQKSRRDGFICMWKPNPAVLLSLSFVNIHPRPLSCTGNTIDIAAFYHDAPKKY